MSIQSANWGWVQWAAATEAAAAVVDAAIVPGQLSRVVAFHWIEWFEMISTSSARSGLAWLPACLPVAHLWQQLIRQIANISSLASIWFDLIWLICGNCRQSWQYAESVSHFVTGLRVAEKGDGGTGVYRAHTHSQPHAVYCDFSWELPRIKHENVP